MRHKSSITQSQSAITKGDARQFSLQSPQLLSWDDCAFSDSSSRPTESLAHPQQYVLKQISDARQVDQGGRGDLQLHNLGLCCSASQRAQDRFKWREHSACRSMMSMITHYISFLIFHSTFDNFDHWKSSPKINRDTANEQHFFQPQIHCLTASTTS